MATKTTVKRIMLFLNVLVFLVGAVIFVSGLVIRFESGLLDSDVITLFNKIEYNGVNVGNALNVTDYMMMAAGGVLMVVAVLGLCAAWKKIRCCLLLYAILALLMIFVQASIVGVWMSVRGRTDEWLKGRMLDLLADYQGPVATDDTSVGWNALFVEAQCCSVNPYTSGTNDFATLPSAWWVGRGSANVPSTCCQGDSSDTTSSYIITCSNTPINYYTEGCYDLVRSYVNTYSIILAAAAAVLLFVEVIAIICSCILLDKMKNRVHHTEGLATVGNGGKAQNGQNVAYVDNVGKPQYKRF